MMFTRGSWYTHKDMLDAQFMIKNIIRYDSSEDLFLEVVWATKWGQILSNHDAFAMTINQEQDVRWMEC